MHKVTKFGEIHMKFVQNSYEFHTNLSEFILFSHETSCGSFLSAFNGEKMQPPCSLGFWAPTAEQTINTAAPREQDAKRGMCIVQIAGVVQKDVTSIANFAKWGGGYPTCPSNCPCRHRQGVGGQAILKCAYIHI